jgi:DHA1 family tetracycline resistance protein-like MFS transporter
MTQTNRLALTFIFITAFVDSIGFGIIIPVLPLVIAELTGEGMAAAADYGGWLGFAFAGMLFLFAPLIGNLSDRFGRRPVLITSLLALGVDYVITGFAPTIGWLFAGRILAGIAGASFTTANAYIADVSPPEERAANFGLVGAAFSLGFIAGPVIGGLLGEFGSRVPFFVSAGLSVANALFGLLVLKESLPQESRRAFDWRRVNPLSTLVALRRFPIVFGMIGIFVLMRLAHDANPAVFTYYVMFKFDWGSREVGYSMMFVGLCMAVVYGGLTRVVIPKIGERRSAYLGLLCGAIGFTGYAFASEGWMIYAWMLIWSLMGFAMPALNAIMSEQVGPSEQGELQGALAGVGGLTSVVAPPLLTHIFSYFSSADAPVYFPGAAFLTAGFLMAIAALLLTRVRLGEEAGSEVR